MTATQTEHQETQRTNLWCIAHRLLFIAGFIMLIAGVANFTAAASVSFQLAATMLSASQKQILLTTIAVLFTLSLLSFIGCGCGWDAALHHMRGEKTSKLTLAKKAFLVLTGILTIIEGQIYWNSFGFGPVMTGIGILAMAFSIPDLFYSGQGEPVRQGDA